MQVGRSPVENQFTMRHDTSEEASGHPVLILILYLCTDAGDRLAPKPAPDTPPPHRRYANTHNTGMMFSSSAMPAPASALPR